MKSGKPCFGETPTVGNQAGPTRRSVLRTSAGVAVGLPLLTSLLPRGVQAATGPKRFVAFRTEHGGLSLPNMVPAASVANETANLFHAVKHGSLLAGAKKNGSDTVVSPILTGASSVLTDKLIGKMNVLLGFDIPIYIGHSRGASLGHFGESDQGPKDLKPFATIDQFMAWAPQFYTSTAGVTQRSIVPNTNISFAWSNPAARSGTVQRFSMTSNTQELFDSLFGGFTPPPPAGTIAPPKRQPVVDRILADYKRLRNSNRRLSAEDKRRLDDHVAGLNELDRRISDDSGPSATCEAKKPATGVSPGSGNLSQQSRDYRLLNDVIAMAFSCGVTRIAAVNVRGTFSDYSTGSWHQDVAHMHMNADKQAVLAAANRATFQATLLDLAAKLDAYEDTPGVSVLDNSLLQWAQESGPNTHDNYAHTVVTFGSAGGFFKTGRFVDYRSGKKGPYGQLPGILYRQWLATALQSMGIPPSAYEGGQPGYGDTRGSTGANYASGIFAQSGKPLPLVTQG